MTSIKALTCFCRTLWHNSFSKTLFPNHNSYYNSPRLSSREKKLFILLPIFSRDDCFTSESCFFSKINRLLQNDLPVFANQRRFRKYPSSQLRTVLGNHGMNILPRKCKRIQDSPKFWIPCHWFRIPATGLRIVCQWNWESRSQSLVGFWNCIPDSKAQHSGF